MGIEIKKLIEAFRAEGVESRCRRHPKIFLALKKPTSTSTGFFFFSFLLFFFLSPKLAPCTSLAPNLQKTTTALAAPSVEPADDNEPAVALIKPLPPPKPVIVVSNAAAPLLGPADLAPAANATAAAAPAPAKAAAAPAPAVAAAAAATPAKAPAPQPKANTTATPPAFSAYTLSAAQATLSPDPATEGLATLILKGLSNVTIPRGSAGVLNGPMHTPTFLATSFPAGSTVELRGSAAAGGGGRATDLVGVGSGGRELANVKKWRRGRAGNERTEGRALLKWKRARGGQHGYGRRPVVGGARGRRGGGGGKGGKREPAAAPWPIRARVLGRIQRLIGAGSGLCAAEARRPAAAVADEVISSASPEDREGRGRRGEGRGIRRNRGGGR